MKKLAGFQCRVDCYLNKLLVGFDVREYAWIWRFDTLLHHIYTLNDDLVAGHPLRSELPWPVVLACGAHSRKHIFAPKKIDLRLVGVRAVVFSNRLRWSIALGDNELRAVKPLMKRRVRTCRSGMPPVVQPFTTAITNLVVGRFRNVRSTPKLPGFIRFTRDWLRKNGMRAELSDKDGVFVVVPRSIVEKLSCQVLAKNYYRPYSTLAVEPDACSVKKSLVSLSHRIERFCVQWGRELRSHADTMTEASLLCKLQVTIKTHKTPPTARLIFSLFVLFQHAWWNLKCTYTAQVGLFRPRLPELRASC